MLPELGHFCLILAFVLALLQCIIFVTKIANVNIMRPVALGQTFFVCIAFSILWCAFITDDFSVNYVVQNSNSQLPFYYKLTALWGAHEGSLLLWVLFLNLWGLALTIAARNWPVNFSNAVLVVFAAVNAGLLAIMLWLSNPFLRTFTDLNLDGMDLNPMLQDFGMIIHPPVLYIGYVGCTVPLAFAIAALLTGKIDQMWARLVQPWILTAWIFLTLGIALGSWWAYYELGWGGWWFWDPVENAAFMPWLTATALIHCLITAKKTGHLLLLAIFLAILTFALSLLGTFLVRSGMIISVHAFARDPQRGAFFLSLLCALLISAVLIYMRKAKQLRLPQLAAGDLPKTVTLMLANNILLLVAAGTVLLGTFYPLLYDLVTDQQISVGYPYFNLVFIPIMLLLFLVMLFGLITARQRAFLIMFGSLFIAAIFLYFWFGAIKVAACIGLTVAGAILATCVRSKNLGMAIAHFGLAICIIGISITPAYEIEKDVSVSIGNIVKLDRYAITFAKVANIEGNNFVGVRAEFVVQQADHVLATLFPEKRTYLARATTMSETAILPGLLQDIYIALGQELGPNTWSVRVYYKPFVRWIWLGAVVMALGAACGMLRRRQTIDLVASVESSG